MLQFLGWFDPESAILKFRTVEVKLIGAVYELFTLFELNEDNASFKFIFNLCFGLWWDAFFF